MQATTQSLYQGYVPFRVCSLLLGKSQLIIVKILFSLITIIIPLKLYKVHSILKSGKGGESWRRSQFGLEASSVESNKGSPAGLREVGGGGPVVKRKKKKNRPPTRKQDERARSWGRVGGPAGMQLLGTGWHSGGLRVGGRQVLMLEILHNLQGFFPSDYLLFTQDKLHLPKIFPTSTSPPWEPSLVPPSCDVP